MPDDVRRKHEKRRKHYAFYRPFSAWKKKPEVTQEAVSWKMGQNVALLRRGRGQSQLLLFRETN